MTKIERTKNASRNILFGVILKSYQIFVPFLMRTAMIYLMGVQYLGLNSLFTSVLQVLNLAELGVGSAMVYSMYKPITEDDNTTICALMKLYRTYYRVIGLVIAVVGCALTPFIPHLIKSDVPAGINIYILYLLNLGATVLSYWLFAYKNSILQAHQRADVVSKVTLVTSTIQYGLQFFVLWAFHDYYFYVIVMLVTQALTNIVTAVCADRLYPQFKPRGDMPREEVKRINRKIRDLFTAKLGGMIIGSADTIVISAFLGLTQLAIYQNYYFIMNAVYGLILVIFSSIAAGMGNSLIVESNPKNYNDLKKFTFLSMWLITVCVCCFAVLYQPFMRLWVGDDLLLDYSFVIMFCIYFFVLVLAMVWATIKDAAGMWKQDRFRPLIGAIVNLCLNLTLVNRIGLYGIILSTVLSYIFVSMPWLVHNVFKYIYKRSCKEYIIKLFVYTFVCVFSCLITVLICNLISVDGILALLLYGIIAVVISCVIQWLFYHKTTEFEKSKQLLVNMVKVRR